MDFADARAQIAESNLQDFLARVEDLLDDSTS
jgi:hypothetical protein